MADEYYNYAMETMFCGYDKGSDKGSFPQRETKDMYYLNIAKEVSKRSTCFTTSLLLNVTLLKHSICKCLCSFLYVTYRKRTH